MGKRKVFRYSEAFKLQIISELESGEVASIGEVSRKYCIGFTTVSLWLKKYGKGHLLPRVIRVETVKEKNKLTALEKENKRLKEALADSHMDSALYKAWFEIACEKFGVDDVEAFKKKLEKRP